MHGIRVVPEYSNVFIESQVSSLYNNFKIQNFLTSVHSRSVLRIMYFFSAAIRSEIINNQFDFSKIIFKITLLDKITQFFMSSLR
jgi:hypothetical protein